MRRVLIALVIGASLVVPATAMAQAPGDRTEAIHPLLFQLLNDNIVLDPAANVAPASRIEFTRGIDDNLIKNPGLGLDLLVSILDKVGVSVPGWLVDLIEGVGDFSNVSIDAKLGPFFDADYGGYFQVQPSSQEGLDLRAAIDVTNNVPAMNSFKCGDEIAILTGSQGSSHASLQVRPSFYDFQSVPCSRTSSSGHGSASTSISASACRFRRLAAPAIPRASTRVTSSASACRCPRFWIQSRRW